MDADQCPAEVEVLPVQMPFEVHTSQKYQNKQRLHITFTDRIQNATPVCILVQMVIDRIPGDHVLAPPHTYHQNAQ